MNTTDRIEELRIKMYEAIERGDYEEILKASQELDEEITKFMRGLVGDKKIHRQLQARAFKMISKYDKKITSYKS